MSVSPAPPARSGPAPEVLSLKAVETLDASTAASRVFEVRLKGLRYVFRLRPRPGSDRLVVALSAYTVDAPPSFQNFSSYVQSTTANLLAISDPSLLLREGTRVSCFLGTSEADAVEGVVAVARRVARALGAAPNRLVFAGHSLGGFGALMAACRAGATGLGTNPFLDLRPTADTAIATRIADIFEAGTSMNELRARDPARGSVLEAAEAALARGSRPRLLAVQNLQDRYTFDQQFRALELELARPERVAAAALFRLERFDAPTGHARVPLKVLKQSIDWALA